ncbi:MAG: HAD-IIB family hydrolase [Bdellovibrionaceae bacterium]|nr:HAD-IIB family hydrolase [Pseudobdellovibrionaceae bacterium]
MTNEPTSLAELTDKIKFVLSDLDDTITKEGRIPSESYSALWTLHHAGIKTIIVTGRPAGWCEMMARTWPIEGVVGENGAFFFRYTNRQMKRLFTASPDQIETQTAKLDVIKNEISKNIPTSRVSSDQFCRMFDLAIDICEDIPPLSADEIKKIISIFEKHGAQAKLSSIHVNGWFGDYDKLTTVKQILAKEFGLSPQQIQSECVYSGDSPNDEPLFSFFKNSVGVRNIEPFLPQLKFKPRFITQHEAAHGFQELTQKIIDLNSRK